MFKSLLVLILFFSQTAVAQQWFRSLPIGSPSLDSSSIFDVNSTTNGARPCPVMTEAQRDAITSPANALCIYNSDTNLLNFYNGTAWGAIGGGSGNTWSDPVDANIIPDTASTWDLGSFAVPFDDIYADYFLIGAIEGTTANNSLSIFGQLIRTNSVTEGSSLTLETRSNSSANANATGDLYLLTGNKTGGTGDSGDIYAQPGTSAGGARGKFKIKDGSEGTSGECWVSTGTDGEGNWDTCPGGGGGALSPTGTVGSPSIIDPSAGITPSGAQREVIFLQSTSGTQAVTANPQIAAGSAVGEELILIGTSATEILTLADGTGLALNGMVSLSLQSTIYLMWDGSKWQEISRR